MSLLQRQFLFMECFTKWLMFVILAKGWRVTVSEAYIGDSINKPTEDTPHLRKGNHFNRLAIDVNLWVFKNGKWEWMKKGNEPEWIEAGEYWEKLHTLCRWGGRFKDANHLSIESPEGMK